ncbi:hypothetical protein DV515_00012738 [Chloebia gouldiae]|uniref:Parathyroid hormone n=1 Tax=Chloebia gouldiae TaxID=44316 RepID=A0A3L8S331_CHLGU|nr:hypothetical protein DV515_00012738 [Chloebia gouldiae]
MTSIRNLAQAAIILCAMCFFTTCDGRPMVSARQLLELCTVIPYKSSQTWAFEASSGTQEGLPRAFALLCCRRRSVSEMQLMHNLGEHRHTVERQEWLQMKLQDVHSALEDARTQRPRSKDDVVLGRRLLPQHPRAAGQKKSVDLDKAYMDVLFKTKP